jgi:tyrosyl-tRNA synthetase
MCLPDIEPQNSEESSIMDKLALITRNTEEVVTKEELEALVSSDKQCSAYVGYEPSGKIHMGHVLTVNKLLDLQQAGFKITVLLADVHAYLNEKGTMDEVRKIADYNKRCFIALGLDGKKTKFVLGSSYQLDQKYMMDVLKLARSTTLNRARRSMDEVSRDAENPKVSQVIYPIMQALDIAHLGVEVAVGGIDQRKIHMLAREGLPDLGYKAPICIHTPILPGLDGKKMSSSKGNYISMDDTPEDMKKKMKGAFCVEGEVKDNPVLALFKYHIMPRYPEIILKRPEKYGGDLHYENYGALETEFAEKKLHPVDLKTAAYEYMNKILEPVRKLMVGKGL